MDPRQLEEFTDAIAAVIKDHVIAAVAPLLERISLLETRKPEPGPKGDKGDPGTPAAPARDGKDGKDAEPALIERIVAEFVGKIPPPAAGRDGLPGQPGRDGKDGAPGAPGSDGKDGLGFDDLAIDYDGEHELTVKFIRGDRVKEYPLALPVIIDRGVYKEGASYVRGDAVSWGGSLFIAQCDTTGVPEKTRDWRLAVKRGQNGKDGKDGKDGARGEPGPRGISFDGIARP